MFALNDYGNNINILARIANGEARDDDLCAGSTRHCSKRKEDVRETPQGTSIM